MFSIDFYYYIFLIFNLKTFFPYVLINSPFCESFENFKHPFFRYVNILHSYFVHYMKRYDWHGASPKLFEFKDLDKIDQVRFIYQSTFIKKFLHSNEKNFNHYF